MLGGGRGGGGGASTSAWRVEADPSLTASKTTSLSGLRPKRRLFFGPAAPTSKLFFSPFLLPSRCSISIFISPLVPMRMPDEADYPGYARSHQLHCTPELARRQHSG